jgi:hypothetical protein
MELEQHNDITLNVQEVLQECECHQWKGHHKNLKNKHENRRKALQRQMSKENSY